MQHIECPMEMTNARKPIVLTISIFALVVSLGCLALYIQFYAVDGATPQQGQERAKDLLIALEQYRQFTGYYPASLTQLTPDYLSAVPRPAWRYTYDYQTRSQGTEYVIYFREGDDADNYCGYSSEAKQWRCTDSVLPY